jgi:hypothetical protein
MEMGLNPLRITPIDPLKVFLFPWLAILISMSLEVLVPKKAVPRHYNFATFKLKY